MSTKRQASKGTDAAAIEFARQHQPDPEFAAQAMEEAGYDYATSRRALYAVFGWDVLGDEFEGNAD